MTETEIEGRLAAGWLLTLSVITGRDDLPLEVALVDASDLFELKDELDAVVFPDAMAEAADSSVVELAGEEVSELVMGYAVEGCSEDAGMSVSRPVGGVLALEAETAWLVASAVELVLTSDGTPLCLLLRAVDMTDVAKESDVARPLWLCLVIGIADSSDSGSSPVGGTFVRASDIAEFLDESWLVVAIPNDKVASSFPVVTADSSGALADDVGNLSDTCVGRLIVTSVVPGDGEAVTLEDPSTGEVAALPVTAELAEEPGIPAPLEVVKAAEVSSVSTAPSLSRGLALVREVVVADIRSLGGRDVRPERVLPVCSASPVAARIVDDSLVLVTSSIPDVAGPTLVLALTGPTEEGAGFSDCVGGGSDR